MCRTPTIPAADFFQSRGRAGCKCLSEKTIQGKSHEQKYTPDLVLNKWQNIQENLCNELPFYSFKNGPKVFQKKHKNHHWIAPPTSLLHGITMRNRDFTENLSHMARSVKKKQRWGIFMSWYTWNQWNIHAFKMADWMMIPFFLPWKDGWTSSNLHPFTNGWPNGFPGISSSCSGLESQSSMVSFPEQKPT